MSEKESETPAYSGSQESRATLTHPFLRVLELHLSHFDGAVAIAAVAAWCWCWCAVVLIGDGDSDGVVAVDL